MDYLLKNEYINFLKLKLANVNGRFLKNFIADIESIESFLEVWNVTDQRERAAFLSNSGSALRSKIRYEVGLLRGLEHMRLEESSGQNLEYSAGILHDLASVIHLPANSQQTPVKEAIKAMVALMKKPICELEDFTALFHSSFVKSKLGSALLCGEKYILSNELYNSFEEEMSITVDKSAVEQRTLYPQSSYLNLSKLFLVHIVVLEDKLLENLHFQHRAAIPTDFSEFDAKAIQKDSKLDEEFLEVRVTPVKSKVQSVVRVAKEHQRYFRLRSSLRSISSASLIDSTEDMSILGLNYSINMSAKKKLDDSLLIIVYCNFISLNKILSKRETQELLDDFQEKMNIKRSYANCGSSQTSSPVNQNQNSKKGLAIRMTGEGSAREKDSHVGGRNSQPTSSTKGYSGGRTGNQITNMNGNNQGNSRKNNYNTGRSGNGQNPASGNSREKRKYSAFSKGYGEPSEAEVKRDRFVSNHETALPLVNFFSPSVEVLASTTTEDEVRRHVLHQAISEGITNQPNSNNYQKKVLKATSSSFYHPLEGSQQVIPQVQPIFQRTSDLVESNLSLSLEGLEFSTLDKNGSSGWTQTRKGDSNFFIGEPMDENRNFAFERFDYSEKDSILNLIEMPLKAARHEEEESKHSLNSSGLSKELSPCVLNSPRTDTSASYVLKESSKGAGSNIFEPLINHSYSGNMASRRPIDLDNHAEINSFTQLDQERRADKIPLKKVVSTDNGLNMSAGREVLYTITEVEDKGRKGPVREWEPRDKDNSKQHHRGQRREWDRGRDQDFELRKKERDRDFKEKRKDSERERDGNRGKEIQKQELEEDDPSMFPKLSDVMPVLNEPTTLEKIRMHEEMMAALRPPPPVKPPTPIRKPNPKRKHRPFGGSKKN